jgi:hypothetical protein
MKVQASRTHVALSIAYDEKTFRLAVAVLLSLAATIVLTWPVWPGFMSFDSLYVYRESIEGVTISQQPPVHAYLFMLSRALGLGTGGLFFFQTFLLFFGSVLIMRRFVATLPVLVVAFAVYVGAFFYFPTMLGAAIVHWKDVLTANFFIFGFALWLEAGERRSYPLLAAAVLFMCLSASARLNAITLSAIPLAMMIVRPFGMRRPPLRARAAAGAIVAAGLFVVYAQMTWRLPDFAPLPTDRGERITMAWDLLGVSACEGVDLLPPQFGPPLTADQLRALYDYRIADFSFMKREGHPSLPATELHGADDHVVRNAWGQVVPAHFGCYAAHRTSVLRGLLGFVDEPIIEPTAMGIDPNQYGLHLEHPAAATAVEDFVLHSDHVMWRRQFLLYFTAPALAVAVVLLLGRRFLVLPILVLSGYAYLAGLVFAAPAIAGRYPFASNVCCLLATVTAAAALIERYVQRRKEKLTPDAQA